MTTSQPLVQFARQHTPWGISDDCKHIAEGIDWFSTPSHGGFRLSPERRAEMPARFKCFVPFNGETGWYEEDCDWCIVALSFPAIFPESDRAIALQTLNGSREYFQGRGVRFDD